MRASESFLSLPRGFDGHPKRVGEREVVERDGHRHVLDCTHDGLVRLNTDARADYLWNEELLLQSLSL